MIVLYIFSLLMIVVSILSATLPLPSQGTIDLQTDPITTSSRSLSITNSTFSASSENVLQIQCNANIYGINLNVESCRQVFRLMVKDEEQITFAERGTLVPHDIPLPYRVQSNDGRCFVQVVLPEGVSSGRASATQVGQAAYDTFTQCVVKYGYGGVANRIGGDNNLMTIVASYKPNVRCNQGSTPGPPWKSCVSVFADMPTTRNVEVWGKKLDPLAQVELPYTILSGERRCMVIIEADDRSSTSWYEVWEAVNAIAYMCVRAKERGGKATRIGSEGSIRVTLFDENPDLSSAETGNGTTVEDLLLPTAGAQNFSAEANAPNSAANAVFQVSSTLLQGNSSLVAAPDDNV